MKFETKYFGILSNFDFRNIDKDNFEILIASGIFNEREYDLDPKEYNDFAIELNEKNGFCFYFVYKNKVYEPKRDLFLEMIYYLKNWSRGFYEDIVISEIDIKVESEFKTKNKLKILEEKYKYFFSQIPEKTIDYISMSGIKTDIKSFEEYICDELIEGAEFEAVKSYLKGIHNYLPEELYDLWIEYFIFSGIKDHCENKKNLILNIKPKTMEENQNSNVKNIDAFYQVCIIEEIRYISNWDDDLSATKKGKILKLLLGKNPDLLRDASILIGKKNTELSKKHQEDRQKAINDIKEILG